MPVMPEVVPDILPQPEAQAGPEVGPEVEPGTAVPPQAEAGLSASASVAPSAPSAEAQPGPDVSQLGRGELLRLLPEEQRAAARRMTTPRIRELVRQAAAEKAAAVTPEASSLAPQAAESAVPQGQAQAQLDDPFGQRSAERPETAFDSEQPIPLPHVDGETSPKAGREAHLARTAGAMNGLRTTAVHAHADERYLPSSDSGVSGKNVSAPTAEVNAAEAGAALSAAQPGPVGRHMADRSGEAREGHDGLTRTVAHVPAGVIRKDEHRSAIAAAKDWLREHVSGPVQTRIGIVEVDANAVQDSLSHSIYQNKLDAVQAIVPVLEQGEYLGTLPDKDGKPIENHYFAGKVRIGERESIVFVRTRKAEGMPNRFYVHEVFTQEEIEKSEGIRGVTSDADRPFRNSSDFYRRILAEYLKVKLAGGKDTTAARKTSPADAGHGPAPEARPDGERHLLSPHVESAGKGVAVPVHETSATGEKAPSGQRPGRTSGEGVPQDGDDGVYGKMGGEAQKAVDPHEGRRGREGSLPEREIAPVLYRGVVPNTGGPAQTTGAIDADSLGVLRDAVKPTRLEEGALSSVQAAGRHLPPPREVFRSPGAEAIRKAVEALNQRAVHAADVRVAEDMRDLPAGLREAFAAQTGRVEGMYDPATDTVWLVAGNLESVERAVEVWAHENLVHHGLRAVFTPQQRRVLLNQLWQATGGMGNDMVRAIARRYGKDPRGNEADRLLVMEEVLARLAERRAQGLLTEQETGWWRKVVQAVLRAWKKLVQSVSGREGRMDAARMERLLEALQGHVMEAGARGRRRCWKRTARWPRCPRRNGRRPTPPGSRCGRIRKPGKGRLMRFSQKISLGVGNQS